LKRQDLLFIVCCLAFFGSFFLIEPLKKCFLTCSAYQDWRGLLMAFLKFSILATMGESIGLRIQKGVYHYKGFGILPRAIVWGFLGMGISMFWIPAHTITFMLPPQWCVLFAAFLSVVLGVLLSVGAIMGRK